jgi:hypothetical protein
VGTANTGGEGGLLRVALSALDSEGERLQRGGVRGLSQCARLARLLADLMAVGCEKAVHKEAVQRSLRLLAWQLHESLGGAGVDLARWVGAAAEMAELKICLGSLVRLVEGHAGGAMGEWAEELLSPLSPVFITLVRGVGVLFQASAQASERRERARESERAAAREAAAAAAAAATGTWVSAGGPRDDFDDEMIELDLPDQPLITARVEETAEAEPPALMLTLECIRIWMNLQPRTAARVAPELSVALQGAQAVRQGGCQGARPEAVRQGAALCLAAAVAACRRCEAVPPNTFAGAPVEPLVRAWLDLMDETLEPLHRALASSKQEPPVRAALRAAAGFARAAPAQSSPDPRPALACALRR